MIYHIKISEKKTYFTSARQRESITAGREFLSWATFMLDEMHMNYYRATVMVKTLLLMIQNGCEWGDLKKNGSSAIRFPDMEESI